MVNSGELALILLTWIIWWAPNNASRWQMGFNSAFKGLVGTAEYLGAAIAQSVQRLATGSTVRGSNPGGGRDFPQPFRPALRTIQPSIQWVRGLYRRVKRPGRGVDHPHHLAPRLKKEYSYTSTPPLSLCGLFWVKFYRISCAIDEVSQKKISL